MRGWVGVVCWWLRRSLSCEFSDSLKVRWFLGHCGYGDSGVRGLLGVTGFSNNRADVGDKVIL